MDIEKGNIIVIDFKGAPKESTSKHKDERPCIVIKSFPELQIAIIVPCTAQKPRYSHYSILYLPRGLLLKDSYILCHQLRTIAIDSIVEKIGVIDNSYLIKIQMILADILEL